jgi:hypothetical protein
VRALPLAVGGVLGSDDPETGFPPFVRQLVGVIHVEVERAHFGSGAAVSLGQVDGEVATPVREGVGLVMVRCLETEPLVVVDRALHVGHREDRIEADGGPAAMGPTCRARRPFSQSRQR